MSKTASQQKATQHHLSLYRANRNRRIISRTTIYLLAIPILVIQLFPVLWALLTSLMTPLETTSVPAALFPAHPTLDSYVEAFQGEIGSYYLNSIIVALSAMVLTMLMATPAAYTFARLNFRFKTGIFLLVIIFSLLPHLIEVIPVYQILMNLELLNTLQGLILPYTVYGLPMAILILVAFFQDTPHELEEAGRVDGLSRFGTFLRIVLPVVLPGLFATATIVFVNNWNEYLFALLFTGPDSYTLPIGIVNVSQTEFTLNFGVLSAATILSIIPLVTFILLLERRIVAGLTSGALKG